MMKTKSIMTYRKWDIVLVPFPFTNLTTSKRRPGLVLSPSDYNQGPDLLIAFVTSKLDGLKRPGDYKIVEWVESDLPKPSMIRMKFATISKAIVVKKIGKLSKNDITGFQSNLGHFFEL